MKNWQFNYLKSRHGFPEALRILEVGAGNFSTLLALAKKYPQKQFYGVDFFLSNSALTVLQDVPHNLTVIKHDARNFNLFAPGYFDFIYSVAVMEHIHELELHLQESYRILKPNGRYHFWESPFWSSSLGHHYFPKPSIISHYAHLYLPWEKLSAGLTGNHDHIFNRLYKRNDLSRLTRTQTRDICHQSLFKIESWEDELDENYNQQFEDLVMENNIYSVRREDLRFIGAKVCLVKPI
jgi:ubiquinone/menaquinone biosynthesis C-methylase UbiE